jgi:hypothetical protein
LESPYRLQAREGLPGVDPQGRVILVITEDNVIAGAMLLDETGFQEQGFFFTRGNDVLNLDSLSKKHSGFDIYRTGASQITARTLSQIVRLSHIENGALRIPKQVYSRQMGQGDNLSG